MFLSFYTDTQTIPNPDCVYFITETVIQFVFDQQTYSGALISTVISVHLHSKQCETLFGVSLFVWL